jgi:hypothetical protein
VFTVLPRWNGVSRLKPSASKLESQSNEYLITAKRTFMTYNSEQ